MKIKLHSQYNHFPKYHVDSGEVDLELWNDGKIWEYVEKWTPCKRGSALLIEPRPLQPQTYELVEKNYEKFDNIFTHDSQLLAMLPNVRKIVYWRGYELYNEPKEKQISFICGNKRMCLAHCMRMELAKKLQDKVDILGNWRDGNRVSIHDGYAPYKYAIVIENYIDDYWFTEKILNAFANKTIPLYFGARNIDEFFNKNGVIQFTNLWDIPDWIDDHYEYLDEIYDGLKSVIEDNYQRVQKYKNFEDWFIQHYGGGK